MIKAIFLDFYGTVVHEDGEVIKLITNRIYKTGNAERYSDISKYWWEQFSSLCCNSFSDMFKTQRELEMISLEKTIEHFQSTENAEKLSELLYGHWAVSPIFEDAKAFFGRVSLPICIVSNIDTIDITKALAYHKLNPAFVVTSEDAKCYKPRAEIFKLALENMSLLPNEVVHIGDSISSDIEGAKKLGIKTIWINRANKVMPKNIGMMITSFNKFEDIKL